MKQSVEQSIKWSEALNLPKHNLTISPIIHEVHLGGVKFITFMQIHLGLTMIHNIAPTIANLAPSVSKQIAELSHGVWELFPSNEKLKYSSTVTNMKCGIELGHNFLIPRAGEAHDID